METAQTAAAKQPAAHSMARKILRLGGNLVFACVLLLMAALVFFVLQSRFTGGTPAVAGYQLYIVEGGSMSPTFELGSIVLVRPLEPMEVRAGDIITYRDPDPEKAETIVTHRVMQVLPTEPPSFITRGDANDADDPLPLSGGNLIGRVYYSVPYIGYLFSFVRTRTGILLLVIVPALLIIGSELRKLFGYAQALEKEKQVKGES